MRGHGHDRPGPVVGQHVVGSEDRQLFAVQRVDRRDTQGHPCLGPIGRLPFDVGQRARLLAVGLEGLALLRGAQVVRQRCIHRDDEEGRAVQRVRAGREDRDRPSVDHEVDVGSHGPADPVLLHQQDAFGPGALQRRHVVQQPVGVVGDLEVPLRQGALGDLCAAALALAGDDLLVGQHRLVVGAPVDGGVLAVGQPALAELQEQPLGPAVVLRVGGVQPGRPVEADGVAPERVGLHVDVGVGPLRRVGVALDGGVLRWQAEGVPAGGVQHVIAPPHPVARHDVGNRPGLSVTHVQIPAGIGEHVQHVALLGTGTTAGPVEVEAVPHRQPGVLHGVWVVRLGFLDHQRPFQHGNKKRPRGHEGAALDRCEVSAAREEAGTACRAAYRE